MSEVLFFWTPAALLTAIAAGIAFGVVSIWLSPNRRPAATAVWVGLAGTFYYLPLAVQRLIEADLFVNGLRTIGTWGLFIVFSLTFGLTLRVAAKIGAR